MSTQHSKAAKEFLKDQQYAHWHDATFWAVRSKRDNMAYGLDEWEQLREKASAIKRHTITMPRRTVWKCTGRRMPRNSTKSCMAS